MFLLNIHRETNCSHNPTGPPREIEVFISFAPEAASTAQHWLLQIVTVEQIPAFCSARTCCLFSLNWADFMFQGVQEAMAPSVGMKSLFLQFLAIDEIWPDKADLRFPALPRASPAHPGDRDSALLFPLHTPLHTTHVQWHGNYTLGVETPLKLPPHRGYLLASNVGWAIFLPLSPSLSPSPPPPRSSPSKDDEMPRRNVTPASKFALGHKLHFDNGICSVGGQIPLRLPFLVLTIISPKDKVH